MIPPNDEAFQQAGAIPGFFYFPPLIVTVSFINE